MTGVVYAEHIVKALLDSSLSFDDKLLYIRRISRLLGGCSRHPSTFRTDLSLDNFQDAVVDASLSVSATTRAKRRNDEMQRPQNLNDAEIIAKHGSKPPDFAENDCTAIVTARVFNRSLKETL